MNDDWFTYNEVAAMLRIKPATLQQWVRAGKVPHRKLGRFVRFTPEDLEQLKLLTQVHPAETAVGRSRARRRRSA